MVAKHKPGKYMWKDPSTGYGLTAGGILFYDCNGVWVVGERKNGEIIYSDIGGRYTFEDTNIYACVARELAEETYLTCQLLPSQVERMSRTFDTVYLNGHDGRPVYMCILVPIHVENGHVYICDKDKQFHIGTLNLNPDAFDTARRRVISENPDAKSKYISEKLVCISFRDLKNPQNKKKFSQRLEKVLRLWKNDFR